MLGISSLQTHVEVDITLASYKNEYYIKLVASNKMMWKESQAITANRLLHNIPWEAHNAVDISHFLKNNAG